MPGERLSIKAPSGNGKTTFLLSLMNLVPFEGSISFDNLEVKAIAQAPNLVSYVSPSEPLFPLSLLENITLGREYDQESINAVLCGLGIHKFADNPLVVIGQDGINLSLGQSQRIRLARALIARSPLLLLDEPFTGLDPESRDSIKNFIISWCKDSTIIVASHDAEDRLLAARHLVIENGVLLEVS
jgi:ABC-type transport system involved in cytochrome bd biosynthesis fused ATPase/permease subunit